MSTSIASNERTFTINRTELIAAPRELWVRAVTDRPVSQGVWFAVMAALPQSQLEELGTRYAVTSEPIGFEADLMEDDDPERELGFDQWWVFGRATKSETEAA